jgi:hypothetical protein
METTALVLSFLSIDGSSRNARMGRFSEIGVRVLLIFEEGLFLTIVVAAPEIKRSRFIAIPLRCPHFQAFQAGKKWIQERTKSPPIERNNNNGKNEGLLNPNGIPIRKGMSILIKGVSFQKMLTTLSMSKSRYSERKNWFPAICIKPPVESEKCACFRVLKSIYSIF